jgi:histidinol dehydrogenase
MKLRRLSSRRPGFDGALAALTRYEAAQDVKVERVVSAIIADVRARGDAAVLQYSRRFDRVTVNAVAKLEIGKKALKAALHSLSRPQAKALREAAERIGSFHARQLMHAWRYEEADGTMLGQNVTPLERVGLYVPGGKAAYPSSVLMAAIPAKVAGVPELVMVSPNPNPLVLAAAAIAGVDRVIAIGGAQAVAALAYGTRSVPRVDKIVGPGNAYVAAAKRQVFGQVGDLGDRRRQHPRRLGRHGPFLPGRT